MHPIFTKEYRGGQTIGETGNVSDFDGTPTELLEEPETTGEINGEYFNHIKKINDIFYDQIKISDQKAAYIFTFMVAFLVSSAEGRGVFNWTRYAHGSWSEAFVSAGLAIASTFSVLFAVMVVLPRHVPKSTSLFWGTWSIHRPIFETSAQNPNIGYLFREYLENADILAFIAKQKYRFVALAFRGLMFTIIFYMLLLLVTETKG